jgi:hypothetical protein
MLVSGRIEEDVGCGGERIQGRIVVEWKSKIRI